MSGLVQIPVSLVLPQDAVGVPRDRWATTPVSALARVRPDGWVAQTTATEDLTAVVTAIQGRDYARIYVKDLDRGRSAVALSPEEQEAVDRAMAR